MRQAAIVIGCSYGDEGKGLATAWLARSMKAPILNVMINGGAQRGHTVDLPDGQRHVFHHFGSSSLQEGTVSCADEDYILNPLQFMREYAELQRDFGLKPRLAVSEACRVSTPYDMMLGQIIEENRGKHRHGSCGFGIWETVLRFRDTSWALRWRDARHIGRKDFIAYCRRITREYIPGRLEDLGMTAGSKWQDILSDESVARAAWLDLKEMAALTESFTDWSALASPYSSLIFEAGQGLALDAENRQDFPYLTPSCTTSLISARRIAALEGKTDTQICYVTRSYLTRHGAGPFPTECPMERINAHIIDRTNVPNPHQQSIRYGFFDGPAVLARTGADRKATQAVLPGVKSAVMVTHLNETGGELKGNMTLQQFTGHFDRVYLSEDPRSFAVSRNHSR